MTMKKYYEYEEVPLSTIKPQGWIKDYLKAQKEGLTGHLDEIGYPFNTQCWSYQKLVEGGLQGWWPYEQVSYWIDGVIRCAHLLDDKKLLEKVLSQVEKSIELAEEDGFIGPHELKKPDVDNQWPHAVYFRALMAHYDVSGDKRIINAMVRHYLSGTSRYCTGREVVNVESMLLLYDRTGDERLLSLALKAFEEYNKISKNFDTQLDVMLSDKKISEHGVTFNETTKIPAIVYKYTGNEKFLKASINAYKKVDRDQMLVDGVHSATERLKGNSDYEGHETCVISDYTWSIGYLFMMTGDISYADKIEKACFNAAQGAIGPYFKSIQYISCPNQVIALPNSNHSGSFTRTPRMAYQPHHYPDCCVGNVNRIMPNYVSRMWMKDREGVITSVLYGPSMFEGKVGDDGTQIKIYEETSYPFSETIKFNVFCEKPTQFKWKFRIPSWCEEAKIYCNGELIKGDCLPGSFVTINRLFNSGDTIILNLPMKLKLINLKTGGVAVERGPLVYSLKIKEKWSIDPYEPRQTKDFPAWLVTPESSWNYALAVTADEINEKARIVENDFCGVPWWSDEAPVIIELPARKLRGWETIKSNEFIINDHELKAMKNMQKCGCTIVLDPLEFTPPIPEPRVISQCLEDETEMITLVPYGCTHLRITVFPNAIQPQNNPVSKK